MYLLFCPVTRRDRPSVHSRVKHYCEVIPLQYFKMIKKIKKITQSIISISIRFEIHFNSILNYIICLRTHV